MWKKIEKATTMCIAALLVIIATVSGTLAYESIVEQEIIAAQNDHRIDVQLLRQRTNADGEYVDITEDPMLVPLATGYTENIIRVKNSGNIDTFNRVIIAVPANLDESMELVKGNGWTLTETIMGQSCGDETCNIYIFTMEGSLKAETISDPAILGVRVDAALEQHGDTYILNDVIYDYSEGLQLKIVAQAVQSAFLESPENAFEKGGMAENPWAPSVTLDSPVSDTALNAVLRTMPTGTDITKSVTNVIFGKRADYGHIMESCYSQPVDDADPNGPWAYYQASADGEGNTTWTVYILSDEKIIFPADCSNMFTNFSNLEEVDLTTVDSSEVTDVSYMFCHCTNLKSVNMHNWNTAQITDFSYMFNRCHALETLEIGTLDVQNATKMQYMFSECKKLRGIDVSGWKTSKVTDMSYLFNGCTNWMTLDLSQWDTVSVQNMRSMFSGCTSLTMLNLAGLETAAVTDMANMFSGCNTLTEIDVGDFDTSTVTNMNSMFSGCSQLCTLNVGGWNTAKVTDMAGMFNGCQKLETLDVSRWVTGEVKNMASMFIDCSELKTLDVSKWDTTNVTNMSLMFCRCSLIEKLDVSKWNTEKLANLYCLFNACSKLADLGEGNVSGWTTGQAIDMSYMFNACKLLTELDVSNFNTANVRKLDYMFASCSSLTKIYASSDWNTSGATSTSMFQSCSNLAGGAGTTYQNNHIDGTYARIDGGESAPGYFTSPNT